MTRVPRTTTVRRSLAVATCLTAALAPAVALGAPPRTAPASAPTPTAAATTRHLSLATVAMTNVAGAGPASTISVAASSIPRPARTTSAFAVSRLPGAPTDAVADLAATGDLVAVTWPAGQTRAASATVLVRVRTAAGWREWHTVQLDPQTSRTGTIGTDPIWTPGAQRVQVRMAASDRDLLARATLTVVTTPARTADTRPAARTLAGGTFRPSIVSRAQWGADESLRPCPTEYSATTKAIVVHHSADTNDYGPADSARMLRAIYAYDTGTLGWCDFPYNVIVDRYGQKFEGRAGGLDRPVRGAHAMAFNTDTFGASILGNFDIANIPQAGLNALADVIAMRVDSYYLDPFGTARLTSDTTGGTSRYAKGTSLTLPVIQGHRDTSYTDCPGRYLYPRLATLRQMVSDRLTYSSSAIYRKYKALGGASALGTVAVGEGARWTGTRATVFTSGVRIYSGPSGTYTIGDAANTEWLRMGAGPGMGNLTGDQATTPLGTYSRFTTGKIITATRGASTAYLVNGGILAYWNGTGGVSSSPYGMATSAIASNATGWWQAFANGHVYWSRAGRGFGTLGAMDRAYMAQGGPNGALGFPTSVQRTASGVTTQTFTKGTITLTASQVIVRKR